MLSLILTHHDVMYLATKLGTLALVLLVIWLLHRTDDGKVHS